MNYSTLTLQLLPEIILVVSALILLAVSVAVHSRGRGEMPSQLSMMIAVLGVLGAAVAMALQPCCMDSASPMLDTGGLSRLFKAVVLGLALPAVMLPPARREFAQPGEFHALMLFAITGLLLTVGASHFLVLFVALELASLSLYMLAGFSRTTRAAEASMKYFLFGGVSAAFFLFGISWLYGFSHDLSFAGIGRAVDAAPLPPFAVIGLILVIVGFGFKLAAAPFHFWAPDVYQGAPATPVALIAAASKAVGVVVLARLLMTGFEAAAGSAHWDGMQSGWSLWLAALAALSIVTGNLLALAQQSVRRLLAYSAVANTGYILVGLAANGPDAFAASLFYVVVYGLATLGALAVAAAVERDRGSDMMSSFAGLVHRAPGLALAMLVCLASLAGIPPLAGFIGKFAIFSSAMAASSTTTTPGLTWLVALGAIMSAVSLYYYLLVLKQIFVHGSSGEPIPADSACQAIPVSHGFAVAVPALLLVALGIFPSLLLHPITLAIANSLHIR